MVPLQARMQGAGDVSQLPVDPLERRDELADRGRPREPRPFEDYRRLGPPPGFGVETTADTVGIGIVAATAAGFAAHGVGKLIHRRVAGDADRPPEPMTLAEFEAMEEAEEGEES